MIYFYLKLNEEDAEAKANGVQNAVLGDKDVLRVLLATSPHIKSNTDLVKYSKVYSILDNSEDNKWIVFDEDLYNWILNISNHSNFNTVLKDGNGNEVPMFPTTLKIKIGEFLSRFEKASSDLPEQLKVIK